MDRGVWVPASSRTREGSTPLFTLPPSAGKGEEGGGRDKRGMGPCIGRAMCNYRNAFRLR